MSFLKSKDLTAVRNQFYFALEKIVIIAMAKTRRHENKSVIKILNDINSIFKKFWALKSENPQKFIALLYSENFYNDYIFEDIENKTLRKEGSQITETINRAQLNAAIDLEFFPLESLEGLLKIIGSFEKIWEEAIKSGNNEIARESVYRLNWLLAKVSSESGNEYIIERFLSLLNTLSYKGLKRSKDNIDSSLFAASTHWYTDIVFNEMGEEGSKFDISYLDLFNRYLFAGMKLIISKDTKNLFSGFISSLVNGIHVPFWDASKVWDYGHMLLRQNDYDKYQELNNEHGIEELINQINNSQKHINSIDSLNGCNEMFDKLKDILMPNFNDEQKEEALSIEKDVREYFNIMYLYSNLLELLFVIGSYCLFKKNYGLIKLQWEYKQPPDSDAIWGGNDVNPTTIESLLRLYVDLRHQRKEFGSWGEHHGSRVYYDRYFIYSLANLISKKGNLRFDIKKIQEDSPFFMKSISDISLHLLETLEWIRENNSDLDGLEIQNSDKSIIEKIGNILNDIKYQADRKIDESEMTLSISENKVSEFKKQVLNSYYENEPISRILNHFNLLDDRTTSDEISDIERFGINTVSHKAAFFEEWYASYSNWGDNYGRKLGIGKKRAILKQIISKVKVEISTDEKLLDFFSPKSNLIIFSPSRMIYSYFMNQTNFTTAWEKSNRSSERLRSIQGYYKIKEQFIPVIDIHLGRNINNPLILNSNHLGMLIQYSPLNAGESNSFKEIPFYMDIKAFSENVDLKTEYLDNPPPWLKDVGDRDLQSEYLSKRVLIQIFERYEFIIDEHFEGCWLKVKS